MQDAIYSGEIDMAAIIKLVANGVGVALVPETAAPHEWPAGVRAIDLKQRTFHRHIGLVHRARRDLSEPVKVLQVVKKH